MEISERAARSLERISQLLTGFLLKSIETSDQRQKIKLLKQCGLDNPEIAELLGTTSNTVKATVHSLKNKKKNHRKRTSKK